MEKSGEMYCNDRHLYVASPDDELLMNPLTLIPLSGRHAHHIHNVNIPILVHIIAQVRRGTSPGGRHKLKVGQIHVSVTIHIGCESARAATRFQSHVIQVEPVRALAVVAGLERDANLLATGDT